MGRHENIVFPILLLIAITIPFAYGWGFDGHIAICRIAQSRLSNASSAAVKKLISGSGTDDLGQLCPWADRIKFRYRWSSELHFVNTPDICSYRNARDCKDRQGANGRCLEGAINNYTTQLMDYSLSDTKRYNLTEALLFLSHFMGDMHQPLHVGFKSDKGGNSINVTWFSRKTVLHHVWDTDIIDKAKGKRNSTIDDFVASIQQKINGEWAKQVSGWEACCCSLKTCPNVYAAESIKAACNWAYKDVRPGSVLKENYYETRLPIVEQRIAQAGIRLAAALNRIFK